MKMKEQFLLSYLAGFLDGQGNISVQLVPNKNYTYLFQIRVSIIFYQNTSRHWFLIQLQDQLGGIGSLKKRKDNVSELAIVGMIPVKKLLSSLLPYLRIKKKTALLTLEIINEISTVENKSQFIEVCKKVDKMAEYTDSRNRVITSITVEKALGIPVETEPLGEITTKSS